MAATKSGPHVKKIIDFVKLKELAGIGCTLTEIAVLLNVSQPTLSRSNEAIHIYKNGQEGFKQSLRRLQYKQCQGQETIYLYDEKTGKVIKDDKGKPIVLFAGTTPSTAMQIFLGKNYLGQSDKTDITSGGEAIKPWSKTTYNLPTPAKADTVPTQEPDNVETPGKN